jgi:hypothetical protein
MNDLQCCCANATIQSNPGPVGNRSGLYCIVPEMEMDGDENGDERDEGGGNDITLQ